MQKKLALAFFIVAAALVVCSVKIVKIVRGSGEDYSKIILSQQNYANEVLPFRRGTITDRNRTILAASERVYNVIIDPKMMAELSADNREATMTAAEQCLGYTRQQLENTIADHPDKQYIRIEKQIPESRKIGYDDYREAFNSNKENKATIPEKAIWFEPEYRRAYPYRSLACTVLGFSGSDSRKGSWGIEQQYNDYLTGVDGREYGYQTADGTVQRNTKPAQDGNTVITTLDFTVQKMVEESMSQFTSQIEADHVGVIVMNPTNGEILAMAEDQSYDLNDPADLTPFFSQTEIEAMDSEDKTDFLNGLWRNFMISDTFEPGSTMKLLTEAAAMEEGLAGKESYFDCDGGQQLSVDTYVRCSHRHGTVSFSEALAFSCNDAMMQIAERMGPKVFCKYQKTFGLGTPTGIDLPGEAAGLLYNQDNMSPVDLGTNCFGQNFTVNMVQMAAAYSSIINGGYYYQPHVVKEILTAEGDVVSQIGTNAVRQTVSDITSRAMRESLQMCVEGENDYCTGRLAKIDGYSVGGKTGTSEKYPRGNNEYVLSFIGFTTVENPQVMVYVIVDNPHDPVNNSAKIAVRLEQMIMSSIIDYLSISAVDADAWAQFKLGQSGSELTDFFGNPIHREEETKEEETVPVIQEPETDADGNVIDQPMDLIPKETEYVDPEGDEQIPAGGILNGDDGPPGSSDDHSVKSGTGDDAATNKR